MQANFFSWVREGVRRAVLLGVTDAVDQMGAPDENTQDIREELLTALEAGGPTARIAASSKSRGGRKRLGRSLKDLDND